MGAKFLAIVPQASLRGPSPPYLPPIQKTYNGISGKLEYLFSVDLEHIQFREALSYKMCSFYS